MKVLLRSQRLPKHVAYCIDLQTAKDNSNLQDRLASLLSSLFGSVLVRVPHYCRLFQFCPHWRYYYYYFHYFFLVLEVCFELLSVSVLRFVRSLLEPSISLQVLKIL